MAKSKYRRLVDLYVTGRVFVLKDGTPLWLQVMNPYQREVVRREAQIAQARLVLAMREHGSDEQNRIRAGFYASGKDAAVQHLVDGELNKGFGKVVDSIRNDPEWTERLDIFDRGQDDTRPMTAEETFLVGKIEGDFYTEIGRRTEVERDYLTSKYDAYSEDELWEAFLEAWLERLGQEAAMEEYRTVQLSYSARACEGVSTPDGWTHEQCAGHEERVWPDYTEIRSLPEELTKALLEVLDDLDLTEREAKNSDRQMSSSGSSQLPSEEGASTPSTSTETPTAPPGTSPAPSPTPSPSSDGSNFPTPISHLQPSG